MPVCNVTTSAGAAVMEVLGSDLVRVPARTPASVIAWAGFPVRGPDGRVVGSFCLANHLPRRRSSRDVDALGTLAEVGAGGVALQPRPGMAPNVHPWPRHLQESLLPPRLPEIPGAQAATRYAAGGDKTRDGRAARARGRLAVRALLPGHSRPHPAGHRMGRIAARPGHRQPGDQHHHPGQTARLSGQGACRFGGAAHPPRRRRQ
jgi:hypothetical protein